MVVRRCFSSNGLVGNHDQLAFEPRLGFYPIQRTNFGSLKSSRLCFEVGWRTNRRFKADKRFERIGKRRNEVGIAVAYISHTYYGFHKHPALRRQKDLGSRRWIDLSLFHFLFRGISLPECQLYSLRQANDENKSCSLLQGWSR